MRGAEVNATKTFSDWGYYSRHRAEWGTGGKGWAMRAFFLWALYPSRGGGGEGSWGRDVNWPLGPGITNLYSLYFFKIFVIGGTGKGSPMPPLQLQKLQEFRKLKKLQKLKICNSWTRGWGGRGRWAAYLILAAQKCSGVCLSHLGSPKVL